MVKLFTEAEAIEECRALGERFIRYYDKYYNTNDDEFLIKMQKLLERSRSIKLLDTNDYLLSSQLWEWFFSACANPQDFMANPTFQELKSYDTFVTKLLNNEKMLQIEK